MVHADGSRIGWALNSRAGPARNAAPHETIDAAARFGLSAPDVYAVRHPIGPRPAG